MFKKTPAIIPALDIDLESSINLVQKLTSAEDRVAAYKISSLNVLETGLKNMIDQLRAVTQTLVIYDHQKMGTDIPSIVEKQVKKCAECGVDGLIGVPLGAGPRTLEKFVGACQHSNITPIVLLEMTHENAADYLIQDVDKLVFDKAIALGVKYFVAPGNKYEDLEKYRDWIKKSEQKAFIMSPGIGSQGGSALEAVQAGTDYPIVGRAIYEAGEPVKVLNQIYEEALGGYKKRE